VGRMLGRKKGTTSEKEIKNIEKMNQLLQI
jgi:hypothetical protein